MIYGYELVQKEFARRDYEGLTKDQAEKLKAKRSEIAKKTLEKRRQINKQLESANRKLNLVSSRIPESAKQALEEAIVKSREVGYGKTLDYSKKEAANARNKILNTEAVQKKVKTTTNQKVDSKTKRNIAKRALDWIKKNPKKSAGIGLGAATLGTGAVLGYQHYKKKKD